MHLFTCAETGEDAVVYRAGPTGVRLARQHSMHPPSMPVSMQAMPPLTLNPRPVPTLAPGQAGHRLGEGWLPFRVLHRPGQRARDPGLPPHDGNLGLISPVPASSDQQPGMSPA